MCVSVILTDIPQPVVTHVCCVLRDCALCYYVLTLVAKIMVSMARKKSPIWPFSRPFDGMRILIASVIYNNEYLSAYIRALVKSHVSTMLVASLHDVWTICLYCCHGGQFLGCRAPYLVGYHLWPFCLALRLLFHQVAC